MQRIIISISELSKAHWTLIYKFINGFYENNLKEQTFVELQKKTTTLTITSNSLDEDASYAYGGILSFKTLPTSGITTFSIIYVKEDDKEDFSDLVPFFLLKQKFKNNITLGIDVGNITLDKNKQGAYTFKCSDFLRFIEDKKPQLGQRSIYFINAKKIDKITKEIKNYSPDNVTSLAGKGKITDKDKLSNNNITNASRRYLPLLKINEENFNELFGRNDSISKEAKYIRESIIKLSKDLKDKDYPIDDIKCHSIFEEWFIKAYFYSLETPYKSGNYNFEGLLNVLHSYSNNIYELVQNIIFHGGKNGLIYFVFNKKENISETQKINIPDFEEYKDTNQRFVEIGIFDFNSKGIVENYIEKYAHTEKFELRDFFDTEYINSTGLNTHLELRYTAHLGIKSFVKSVLNNKGYFRVESNNNGEKQSIESSIVKQLEGSVRILNVDNEIFTNGTHYKIILPVKSLDKSPTIVSQPQTQKKSFVEKLHNRIIADKMSIKHIRLFDILVKHGIELAAPHSKDEQIEHIKSIGNEILSAIEEDTNVENEIAINLSGFETDIKFIFKLLSYIQLSHKTTFEKIILTHITDDYIKEFCDTIQQFLIEPAINPIWSKYSALILVSNELHYQIICGETTDELYFLNTEFEKYYYPRDNYFKKMEAPSKNLGKLADKFILPYEVLIEKNKCSYFEQYVLNILKKSIESEEMGYRVSHENTYIGSKLIIKNFYEADTMFQNSFYAERFAYLISRAILQSKCLTIDVNNGKKVVIVGYKPYSELLVKTIKRLLDDYIKTVVIANEEKDGEGIIFEFDKSKGNTGQTIEEKIKQNPNNYKFITIVPIGSTLTTNDKIIAFFKLHIKKENKSDLTLPSENFIHNHCAIVVRDKVDVKSTPMEIAQKWEEITEEKVIKTTFKNAEMIHFSVQIGAEDNKVTNWLSRLNNEVSFPNEWWNEQYVNFTENSSINSQNLMGYPRVNKSNQDEKNNKYKHEIELDRLHELKENIYSGHIECHKSHYSYYIDTETYIKRKDKQEFTKWKKQISRNKVFKDDVFNVLITPNAKIQSDFIETINDEIFSGDALIIYLDVSNWRNNIIHKLSYLRQFNEKENEKGSESKEKSIRFHYVDHALLTSETYKKVKSYMFSILKENKKENENENEKFSFTSIITLINRLSYDRDMEIKRDVKYNLFAFLNLFIPPSKDPERDCSLCILFKHYDKIKRNTVLESCNNVISNNLSKIRIRTFNKISDSTEEKVEAGRYSDDAPEAINERKFIRMMLTHEIFYIISNIESDIKQLQKEEIIKQKLDELYYGINKTRLDKWYEEENSTELYKIKEIKYFQDNKFDIDKKISFLKVISSPPLSQYIKMRSYAHEKLLEALTIILPKKNGNNNFIFEEGRRYKYDDLRKLKAILKSLSFLKSNALVRKDVIIGAWAICFKVMNQLQQEIDEINELKVIIENFKVEQGKLDSENSTEALYLISNEINKELETLNKGKDELTIDFKSDFQFFIKNAIFEDEAKAMYLGELLRTGEEISNFGNPFISKTKLSLKPNLSKLNSLKRKNEKNHLFEFDFNKINISDDCKKEYTDFLVWLFYDNTTIIRRTLQNFENELKKDKTFENYFYDYSNGNKQLKSFYIFNSEIDGSNNLVNNFKEKVKDEYYYSTFRNYLDNLDEIEFVKKLIYVIYAKFKLKDLVDNKHKTDIETDIKSLLEIFAAIMDADAALFAMKKKQGDNDLDTKTIMYPISLFGKIGTQNIDKWDYDDWIFDNQFFSAMVLKQEEEKFKSFTFPILTRYNLSHLENETPIDFGEKVELKASHLNILLINNPGSIYVDQSINRQTNLISIITFLYEKKKKRSEKDFRILSQESGRLLLLLKNELNKYVIEYLQDEKVFDLWVEERKRYELYKLPDHNYYNNLAELKDALESNDKEKIDFLYSMVFEKIKLRNYLIGADISTLEKSDLNIKNKIEKYCRIILGSFLYEFVVFNIDDDLHIEFSEDIFKEILAEYILNIKRVLPNGLPSCCGKELEIIITVEETTDDIIFYIVNDFFVSKNMLSIVNEISTHGHINGAKREKGLSFNERLLKKVGSEKPNIKSKVIDEEKLLGEFKVIFNLKKQNNYV